MKRSIRLRGVSGPIKSKVWHSEHLLRSGRLSSLEIVLDDSSVSRKHAEVCIGVDGSWYVKDLGSTNGTYVNGHRAEIGGELPLQSRDIVQFGKIAFMVELVEAPIDGPQSDQLVLAASLEAANPSSEPVALKSSSQRKADGAPRPGEQLFALLRAGQYLVDLQSEEQLLESILKDAVSVLDAQRGVILLAEGDGPDPVLKFRKMAVGPREANSRYPYSRKLVQQAFQAGASQLHTLSGESEEQRMSQSLADGTMGSVLCVLLRTPRRKLGVLHLDRPVLDGEFTNEDLRLADALAAHVSAGIECSLLLRQQRNLFLKTITALADMVELRDKYTGGHNRRVTLYATALANKMDLPADQMELISLGTPLHDIGKIGISDAILQKPGRLTAKEFADMQTHTTLGAEYLAKISELSTIIPIVRNHHERWDGTGYPDRLAGEEIPLLARIVGVCDAFDAITSDRPYHENKKGKSPDVGFAEIMRQSGRQFDPACAQAFIEIREDILRIMFELSANPIDRVAETGPPTAPGYLPGQQPISSTHLAVLAMGDSYADFNSK